MENSFCLSYVEVGVMKLTKAKKIVLNSYPQAFIYRWGIGRKNGTNLIVSSESPISTESTLARIHRPMDHPLSLEIFKELVWKQAAFNIMKEMIRKLES